MPTHKALLAFMALLVLFMGGVSAMDMTTTTTSSTDCVSTSSTSSCSSFVYNETRITSDMQGLCSNVGNPYLPACSVWRACVSNSSSIGNSSVCSSFSLLSTVCTSESSSYSSCSNYNNLCNSSSVVTQCTTSPALTVIPSASVASANLRSACGSTTTGACAPCQAYWANNTVCKVSNLIELYSEYCYSDSSNSYCSTFNTMCTKYPNLYLCTNVSIASYSDCMFNPTKMSCMNYNYPSSLATSDILSLCTAMPYMSGCTVYRQCAASGFSAIQSATDTNACDPFDIVTTICKLDTGMSMMTGCRRAYNAMCASGTMIKECSNYTGLTVMPSTKVANSLSKDICTEMTMDGCDYCTSDWTANKTYCTYADLVELYSYLCYSMPSMTQCSTWSTMCAADPTLFLCTFSSNSSSFSSGPTMMMYFNTELPFYLLWKSWTPKDSGKLCGAFFAMFFLTLFYELCQLGKSHLEAYERRLLDAIRAEKDPNFHASPKSVVVSGGDGACGCDSDGNSVVTMPSKPALTPTTVNTRPLGLNPTVATILLDVLRMCMAFITSGIGYLLMLGVMCFNVTIFFSVITGFGIGALLFGRLKMRVGGAGACSLSEAMCH